MGVEVTSEVEKLIGEGKTLTQVRMALEEKGYSSGDIAAALAQQGHVEDHSKESSRNSRLLAAREIFDRIGYGAATPQFVNILFWISAQTSPYILFIIGLLNGFRNLFSVIASNIFQEYNKLHKFSKNSMSAGGIVFGFSFLLLAFALLIRSKLIFGIAFLVGALSVVAYGDLYNHFVKDTIKKERMSPFLRGIAHWGVFITAIVLLFSGYLLDAFPFMGKPVTLFGRTMTMYGYLLTFEVTALSFIIAGYVTSFVNDKREERKYEFVRFLKEHYHITLSKIHIFWSDKYVLLLTLASIISGLLQILITAYSGIAIYKIFAKVYSGPFLALAIVYAIAVIASFTGPFFTQHIHRSTGLAPTLVFGTLLMAIFPLVLVYNNANIVAITAGLSVYVIGTAITSFAQGLLAQKLMNDEVRRDYFRVQSAAIVLPYIILIPVLSWIANALPLNITFLIIALGLVFVVMPLYFILVLISQKLHL